jgi:hypothetical protein
MVMFDAQLWLKSHFGRPMGRASRRKFFNPTLKATKKAMPQGTQSTH